MRLDLVRFAFLSTLFCACSLQAAISVTLQPSVASPAPVGTLVHWSVNVNNSGAGPVWHRFRSRLGSNANFHVIVDYGPKNSLDWTEIQREGSYQVEVAVQDKSTGEMATAVTTYKLSSLVTDNTTPVVTATQNPLVFIYGAPGCPTGQRMLVTFQSPDGVMQSTPYQACHPNASMNFYLAGMRAQTAYTVQHTLDTGSGTQQGPALTLTTGSPSITMPNYTVYQPRQAPTAAGILLQFALYVPTMATDLAGNLLWYYNSDITIATRAEAGGYFMGIHEDSNADPSQENFRKFDLAGTTLAETNAARVNEQLAAIGKRPINAFHHEARALAGGGYLVLGDNEQILTDVQGAGAVDVIGDEILVLDSNLQLVWAWDAFDHLDTTRMATLGETCPGGAGCAPYHQAAMANDWLHGNSLEMTPDGQILYSARHQDFVYKINYAKGQGDGSVIWRLGNGGDFQMNSSDPNPWFSHQHDANVLALASGTILTIFDDGNVRYVANPSSNSRGQMLTLDEQNLNATLVLNADLGAYSYALGAAQRLPDGTFHFDVGWVSTDPVLGQNASRSVEVNRSGSVMYGIGISTPEYRTFRVKDLYTPLGS